MSFFGCIYCLSVNIVNLIMFNEDHMLDQSVGHINSVVPFAGVSIHQTGRSALTATFYTCCLNMPHDAPCPRPFKVHQHLAQYFDGKRGQNLHPNM